MRVNHLELYEDAYLNDELGSLGFAWSTVIGSGLDFLGKKKQLDAQKDALKAQLAGAEKARQVALLQLEAAKVAKEAAQLTATANAAKAKASAAASPLGFNIAGIGLPVIIGGALLALRLFKR